MQHFSLLEEDLIFNVLCWAKAYDRSLETPVERTQLQDARHYKKPAPVTQEYDLAVEMLTELLECEEQDLVEVYERRL